VVDAVQLGQWLHLLPLLFSGLYFKKRGDLQGVQGKDGGNMDGCPASGIV